MEIKDFIQKTNYVLRISVNGVKLTITKQPERAQAYINSTEYGVFLGNVTYHNSFLNCHSTTTYGVDHSANIDYEQISIISTTTIEA